MKIGLLGFGVVGKGFYDLTRARDDMQIAKVVGKYKTGRYREYPHLVRHFRVKELTIHCDKPTPINLDGELRMAQTVDISLAREKIRFFYPKGLTWKKETPAEKYSSSKAYVNIPRKRMSTAMVVVNTNTNKCD